MAVQIRLTGGTGIIRWKKRGRKKELTFSKEIGLH
jgi:hypothetical protein